MSLRRLLQRIGFFLNQSILKPISSTTTQTGKSSPGTWQLSVPYPSCRRGRGLLSLCLISAESSAQLISAYGNQCLVQFTLPAKQPTRCLAPASPVFAGTPAPTGVSPFAEGFVIPAGADLASDDCIAGLARLWQYAMPCGSGRAREASDAVFGESASPSTCPWAVLSALKRYRDCSGQLIPDTGLSFSSAIAGGNPPLN